MIISLKSLYEASWLFLPLLVLCGVLAMNSHARATPVLFKTTYYYVFGLIAIYTLIPTVHEGVRDLLLDLVTRFYMFVQSAEQLWIEWGISPVSPQVNAPSSGGQGEKPIPKPVVLPAMPRTYKMRVVYFWTTMVYLSWLLLGVAFSFTRF